MKKIAMKETARIHRSSPRLAGLAAAVALSLAGTNVALAQGAGPWDFSANIGAVSNYMWRGVTQTGDGAAVQGGLDVAHESGFYAGTWASNIDWDDGTQTVTGVVRLDPTTGRPTVVGTTSGNNSGLPTYELDLYAGYDFSLPDENASLGLNTIYYAYPDSSGNVDFWEIGISGGYDFGPAAVSGGIQYTAWNGKVNDGGMFAEGDLYYSAALDVPLPRDFSFGVFGGYYDFDNDRYFYADSNGVAKKASYDYWHWGATVSKEAGDFGTFSFTYEQVDADGDYYDEDAQVWVGWNKTF
ncbi:TorF family putative porin [Thiorhodovibrio frisius]|uniref:Uncharacterized protein n=1 Tax=Thiorhodovibrio frisius TaxID=631362 RepID=H8Z5W9_9GAMM|nr:TorF family putative porin [Thiorhodovibrio frisius]EIC20619.1 conserved hypothetical protein, proteobacterial [Thiorhodovibrio frisius]WPL21368.1 hypothetical protein Thiofri_01493 [Thiorhodovibrio frisius]